MWKVVSWSTLIGVFMCAWQSLAAPQIQFCDQIVGGVCTLTDATTSLQYYWANQAIDFKEMDKAYGSGTKTIAVRNVASNGRINITSIELEQRPNFNLPLWAFKVITPMPLELGSTAGDANSITIEVVPSRAANSTVPSVRNSFFGDSPWYLHTYLRVTANDNDGSESFILWARVTVTTRTVELTRLDGTLQTLYENYPTDPTSDSSTGIWIGQTDTIAQVSSYTYKLQSAGDLNVSSVTLTSVSGDSNALFTLTSNSYFDLSHTSTLVNLTFDPETVGDHYCIMTITSNSYLARDNGAGGVNFTATPDERYYVLYGTGTDEQLIVRIFNHTDETHFAVVPNGANNPSTAALTHIGGYDINHARSAPLSLRIDLVNVGLTILHFHQFSSPCPTVVRPDQAVQIGNSTDGTCLGEYDEVFTIATPNAFVEGSSIVGNANISRSVEIHFTPIVEGPYETVISIHSSDYEDEYYTFKIAGEGTDPELSVEYVGYLNRQTITDGMQATHNQGTSWGNLDKRAGAVNRTFAIRNDGTATLLLGDDDNDLVVTMAARVENGAISTAHFNIYQGDLPSSLEPGEEAFFIIELDPQFDVDVQPWANVTIHNSDADESGFHFTIIGELTDAKIRFNVSQTDFGLVDYIATTTLTGTIENIGTTPLYIGDRNSPTSGFSDYFIDFVPDDGLFRRILAPEFDGAGSEVAPGEFISISFSVGNQQRSPPLSDYQWVGHKQAELVIKSNDFSNPFVRKNFTFTGIQPRIKMFLPPSTTIISGTNNDPIELPGKVDIDSTGYFNFGFCNTGYSDLEISDLVVMDATQQAMAFAVTNFTVPYMAACSQVGSSRQSCCSVSQTLIPLEFAPRDPDTTLIYTATVGFTTNDYQLYSITNSESSYDFTFSLRGESQDIDQFVFFGGNQIITGTGFDVDEMYGTGSASFTFMVANGGIDPLNIEQITCTDDQFTVTSQSGVQDGGPFVISPADGNVTFTITYVPGEPGLEGSASCSITSNEPTSPFDINFDWIARGPVVSVTEIANVETRLAQDATRDYAIVNLGDVKTKTFRIQNRGNYPLNISAVNIIGVLIGDPFNVTDNATGSITLSPPTPVFRLLCTTPSTCPPVELENTPSDFLTVEVEFEPLVDERAYESVVNVHTNDFDLNVFTFTTKGIGGVADIALYGLDGDALIANGDVSPSEAEGTAFGTAQIFDQTITRSFVLDNPGSGPLTVSDVGLSVAGEFSLSGDVIVSGGLTYVVPPRSNVSFTATFLPQSVAPHLSVLTITNDDREDGTFTFQLGGEGINRQLNTTLFANMTETNPASIETVSVGLTRQRQFAVENVGDSEFNITSISIEQVSESISKSLEDTDEFFTISAPDVIVPAHSTVYVTVSFAPHYFGNFTARVTMETNDFNNPVLVFFVSGSGSGPEIGIIPDDVAMGDVNLRTTKPSVHAVVNSGDELLVLSSASLLGDVHNEFELETSACLRNVTTYNETSNVSTTTEMLVVPAHSSCELLIEFSPASRGERSVQLSVVSNDFDEPTITANISARGTEPELELDAPSFDEVSTYTLTSGVLNISNEGDGELIIDAFVPAQKFKIDCENVTVTQLVSNATNATNESNASDAVYQDVQVEQCETTPIAAIEVVAERIQVSSSEIDSADRSTRCLVVEEVGPNGTLGVRTKGSLLVKAGVTTNGVIAAAEPTGAEVCQDVNNPLSEGACAGPPSGCCHWSLDQCWTGVSDSACSPLSSVSANMWNHRLMSISTLTFTPMMIDDDGEEIDEAEFFEVSPSSALSSGDVLCSSSQASSKCYMVEMMDSFGDGWNGNHLSVGVCTPAGDDFATAIFSAENCTGSLVSNTTLTAGLCSYDDGLSVPGQIGAAHFARYSFDQANFNTTCSAGAPVFYSTTAESDDCVSTTVFPSAHMGGVVVGQCLNIGDGTSVLVECLGASSALVDGHIFQPVASDIMIEEEHDFGRAAFCTPYNLSGPAHHETSAVASLLAGGDWLSETSWDVYELELGSATPDEGNGNLILSSDDLSASSLPCDTVAFKTALYGTDRVYSLPTPKSVAAFSHAEAIVSFKATDEAIGELNLTVTVLSNDRDSPNIVPFPLSVVQRNIQLFVGGRPYLQLFDSNKFSFSTYAAAGNATRDFTVTNGEISDLKVSSVDLGTRIGEWDVDDSTLSGQTIEEGAGFNFTIIFVPTPGVTVDGPWEVGLWNTQVEIHSDDLNLPVFNLNVEVDVFYPRLTQVRGFVSNTALGQDISRGQIFDLAQGLLDGTYYDSGQIGIGGVVNVRSKKFRIYSSGQTPLTLEPPYVDFTGGDAALFTLVAAPSTTYIPVSSYVDVTVNFAPLTVGLKETTMNIYSDDYEDPVFSFQVGGNATDRRLGFTTVNSIDGTTTEIIDQQTYLLGVPLDQSAVDTTFTIKSIGASEFYLSRIMWTTDLTACGSTAFQVIDEDGTYCGTTTGACKIERYLFPNATIDLTVRFDAEKISPPCMGDLVIEWDDETDDRFEVRFNAFGTGPDINANWGSQSGEVIVNQNTQPYEVGTTDLVSGAISRSAFVYNIGSTGSTLDISAVHIDNPVFTSDFASPVSIGISVYREIAFTFDPMVLGVSEATVILETNDYDEGNFTFRIWGAASDARIELRNSDSVAILPDTDIQLPDLDTRNESSYTLLVGSKGLTDVEVSAVTVDRISGVGGWSASIAGGLPATVTSGALVPVVVTFDPDDNYYGAQQALGIHNASITISSNDYSTPDYVVFLSFDTINVEIAVHDPHGNYVYNTGFNGGPASGYRNLGAVPIESGNVTATFTISNAGFTPLQLSTAVFLLGNAPTYDRTAFSITQQPPLTLNTSQSGELVVFFDPITAGRKRVMIQISSNDFSNPQYVFELMGYGVVVGDPIVDEVVEVTNEDGYGTVPMVLGLFFAVTGAGIVCTSIQTMARTKITSVSRSKVGQDNPFLQTDTEGLYNGVVSEDGDDPQDALL